MILEYSLSPRAWDDLDALLEAVEKASGSAETAADTYEGVLKSIEKVALFPLSAPSVQGRTGVPCDYRWAEYKGWLAFYHVESEDKIVVDRVLWSKSEWLRRLGFDEGDE